MTLFIQLFVCLLFVHVLADFYLQPYSWIMDKVKYKEKSLGLLKHIGVHVVLTSIVLLVFTKGLNTHTFLPALLIIITSHYAIDIWKTYMGFTSAYFIADQAGHILVLLAVSFFLSPLSISDAVSIIQSQMTIQHGAIALAYLIAFKPLSILIQLLLRPYLTQFDDNAQQQGLQTAGEHIGALERILIVTFVLLDQYSGIGFLLAAKSVFRFGDMRRQHDRKLTEYIMLGTLLSFSTAILLGLMVGLVD